MAFSFFINKIIRLDDSSRIDFESPPKRLGRIGGGSRQYAIRYAPLGAFTCVLNVDWGPLDAFPIDKLTPIKTYAYSIRFETIRRRAVTNQNSVKINIHSKLPKK
jgi:hypothetical protein